MIVVLADDLSGAAELAGAALAHGFTAEVQTRFTAETKADVVCVDTDSRSLPASEAAQIVGDIATHVTAAKPGWIYKKCDSVLRGNVLAEIRAIQAAMGKPRATLVSANPTRGRVIRRGDCFVNGEPLHTTAFAHDPEHPRRTSRVAELLGGDLIGVNTPDAETTADLERHAATVDTHVLPAGGVEFFTALLHQKAIPASGRGSERGCKIAAATVEAGAKLMVCGSAAAWAKGRRAQMEARGWIVEPMPHELLTGSAPSSATQAWAERISRALNSRRNVLAAIGSETLLPEPARLADALAAAVAIALRHARPMTICAEGGATAAAVSRALGWTRFAVGRELAGGVVELRPVTGGARRFVIKVGSYDWPEGLLDR
jgi:uncharacterized protein YgbK (DUF1537 family)